MKAFKKENDPYIKYNPDLSLEQRRLARTIEYEEKDNIKDYIRSIAKGKAVSANIDDCISYVADEFDLIESQLEAILSTQDSAILNVDSEDGYTRLSANHNLVDPLLHFCGQLEAGNFQNLDIMNQVLAIRTMHEAAMRCNKSSIIFHDTVENEYKMPYLKSKAQVKLPHFNPNSGNNVIMYVWFLPSANFEEHLQYASRF